MAIARTQIVPLDPPRLDRLQSLEKELGACLVAVEPQVRYADLSPEQLRRLQAAERDMGVILLAYDCRPPGPCPSRLP